MSDYTSRCEAIKALDTALRCGAVVDYSGIEAAIDIIRDLPAADVRPVVRAKWLTWEEQFPGRKVPRKNRLGVFCSNTDCRKYADNMTDYCPNCGAIMTNTRNKSKI